MLRITRIPLLVCAMTLSACIGESHTAAPIDPCASASCDADSVCVPVIPGCTGALCVPYATCHPRVDDPCAGVRCEEGTVCALVDPSLERHGDRALIAPGPVVDCVPLGRGPCESLRCAPDEQCRIASCDGPGCVPYAECVPSQTPCDTALCAPGFRCVNRIPECLAIVPECEPYAECIPTTGTTCETLECLPGEVCVELPAPPCEGCVGTAICQPVGDPCSTVRCGAGTHCEVIPTPCFGPGPCPDIAACLPNDPCDDLVCEPGTRCEPTICIDFGCEDLPPAQCVPVGNSCTDFVCAPGQHCELREPPCAIPLPGDPEYDPPVWCDPVPTCVDDDPCALIDCAPGYVCEPTVCIGFLPCGPAQCVPVDPCSTTTCDPDQHCELLWPPCPFDLPEPGTPAIPVPLCEPVAVCVDNPIDACDLVDCQDGFHCELVDTPCPPPEPWDADPPACGPVPTCLPDADPSACDVSECGPINFVLPPLLCEGGDTGGVDCVRDATGICAWTHVCPGDPCDRCDADDIPECPIPGEPAGECIWVADGSCEFIPNDACI